MLRGCEEALRDTSFEKKRGSGDSRRGVSQNGVGPTDERSKREVLLEEAESEPEEILVALWGGIEVASGLDVGDGLSGIRASNGFG